MNKSFNVELKFTSNRTEGPWVMACINVTKPDGSSLYVYGGSPWNADVPGDMCWAIGRAIWQAMANLGMRS